MFHQLGTNLMALRVTIPALMPFVSTGEENLDKTRRRLPSSVYVSS